MGGSISEPSAKGGDQPAIQIINSHYMIITTQAGIGREQINLDEQYLVRDGEMVKNADSDQQQRQLTRFQVDYDGLRMRRFLNQHMDLYCKINTKAIEDELTRESILDQIKGMFEIPRSGSLIYVSGCSGQKQTQLFFQAIGLDFYISFKEIVDMWQYRNPMQSSLLLILDFNYSGTFIEELIQMQQSVQYFYSKSISIIASSHPDQINLWTQQGSLFSLNFLKTFDRYFRCDATTCSIYAPEKFQPVSFCNLSHLNKIFGIQMQNFSSWEELELFQQFKQEFRKGDYFGKQVQSTVQNPKIKEWYQGQWRNDLYHGRGVLFYDNDDVFEGNFFCSAQLGKGVYYYRNGDKFEGMFSENKRNGYGKYTFKDGSYEEGEYVDGVIQGPGKYVSITGDNYEGNYENGRWNGRGRYQYSNKERYQGMFLNNLRHGVGSYFYSNGIYYRGIYEQDVKNGRGVFVLPNGKQIQAEYQMDILKNQSSLKQDEYIEKQEPLTPTNSAPRSSMQPSMGQGFIYQFVHQRGESNTNPDQAKEQQANINMSVRQTVDPIKDKVSQFFNSPPEEPVGLYDGQTNSIKIN